MRQPDDRGPAAPADLPDDPEHDEDVEEEDLGAWLAFTAVRVHHARRRGWTEARQRLFILALSRCGVVKDAAARVGMSARSAYLLRERPDADEFDAAWVRAQEEALGDATAGALEIGLNGIAVPIVRGGEVIGERRKHLMSRELRIFTAIGHHLHGREGRANAAEDRQWRRECARNRRMLDEADRLAAAEAEARRTASDRWIREAMARDAAERRPRIRRP